MIWGLRVWVCAVSTTQAGGATSLAIALNTVMSRMKAIVRRTWTDRVHYPRRRDWLLSLYNRMLLHLPYVPLAGRRREKLVCVSGLNSPLHIRLDTSDWWVMEEIFIEGEYEPLVRHGMHDIRNVLDLGSNIGMTLRRWQTLWPAAHVVAVEPDPQNLDLARRNVEASVAAEHPPVFLQACVAGHSRVVHLDRSTVDYAFEMREGAEGGEAIDALTVPQICERAGVDGPIDLLKCDIEGAEEELFNECAPWIGRVRYLAVEVHEPYTRQKLLTALKSAGAKIKWVGYEDKGPTGVVFAECEPSPAPAPAPDRAIL
jgi:FkbM family methyltransferase